MDVERPSGPPALSAPRLFGVSLGWIPYAAGPVWMVLTAGMAYASLLAARQPVPQAGLHAGLVAGLVVLCWLHPFYTWAADRLAVRRIVELAGSVVTLLVAVVVVGQVRHTSARAATVLLPVLLWLAVASYYLAEMWRRESRATREASADGAHRGAAPR